MAFSNQPLVQSMRHVFGLCDFALGLLFSALVGLLVSKSGGLGARLMGGARSLGSITVALRSRRFVKRTMPILTGWERLWEARAPAGPDTERQGPFCCCAGLCARSFQQTSSAQGTGPCSKWPVLPINSTPTAGPAPFDLPYPHCPAVRRAPRSWTSMPCFSTR